MVIGVEQLKLTGINLDGPKFGLQTIETGRPLALKMTFDANDRPVSLTTFYFGQTSQWQGSTLAEPSTYIFLDRPL